IASRRGIAAEVVRHEWAEARARLADEPPPRVPRPVSRRTFLVAGGAAAAWTALGANRLDAAPAPPAKKAPARNPSASIAIVGAGMAGLTAALTLQDGGTSATVYEA